MNPTGNLGVLIVPLVGDALSDRAVEAVRELRAEYIPAAFADSGATVLVTGTTAENIDRSEVMSQWLPIVLAFVLGLSFLLLTLAFRSVVVATAATTRHEIRSAGFGYPGNPKVDGERPGPRMGDHAIRERQRTRPAR